mmetsp:Transcript_26206/g.61156  ORF Transcript_26206/g.61156 Transcript_26206/m.61156 type:complete len:95 (-) Transcript_26206:316-600(-)
MTAAGSSAVAAWLLRKNSRCEDPLQDVKSAQVSSGSGPLSREPEGMHKRKVITARIGRSIVARSSAVQMANQRYYFPLEDCCLSHFESSTKRWR